MSSKTQLTARPIEAQGKGALKRLRKEGRIPVSVQHKGQETLHFEGDARSLEEFIRRHGQAGLLDLMIEPEAQTQTVYVHDMQRHPVTGRLVQVTFQRVEQNEPMKAHVPLAFHGEPAAAHEDGYIVQRGLESVEVRCLPADLPAQIVADLTAMTPDAPFRVSDLPVPDRVELLTAQETPVASLVRTGAEIDRDESASEAGGDEAVVGSETPV